MSGTSASAPAFAGMLSLINAALILRGIENQKCYIALLYFFIAIENNDISIFFFVMKALCFTFWTILRQFLPTFFYFLNPSRIFVMMDLLPSSIDSHRSPCKHSH